LKGYDPTVILSYSEHPSYCGLQTVA
jgi:hypothetical protein